jgi:hypothetical protein
VGYTLSWLAVRGKSGDALRAELGLIATGARELIPESPLVAASLQDGWTLVLANDTDRFIDDELLLKASRGAEVVCCFLSEMTMLSRASGWRDGRSLWTVDHDASVGLDHLDGVGEVPPAFDAIKNRLAGERAAGGQADYFFDGPLELAKTLVGFRHDEDVPGGFEVLVEARAVSEPERTGRREFWKRLLGRSR